MQSRLSICPRFEAAERGQRVDEHRSAIRARGILWQDHAIARRQLAVLGVHRAAAHAHALADQVLHVTTRGHHKAGTLVPRHERLADACVNTRQGGGRHLRAKASALARRDRVGVDRS
jgi:hypothetical protein